MLAGLYILSMSLFLRARYKMAYNSPERQARHASQLPRFLVCKLLAINCRVSVEFVIAFICKFINFNRLHSINIQYMYLSCYYYHYWCYDYCCCCRRRRLRRRCDL